MDNLYSGCRNLQKHKKRRRAMLKGRKERKEKKTKEKNYLRKISEQERTKPQKTQQQKVLEMQAQGTHMHLHANKHTFHWNDRHSQDELFFDGPDLI